MSEIGDKFPGVMGGEEPAKPAYDRAKNLGKFLHKAAVREEADDGLGGKFARINAKKVERKPDEMKVRMKVDNQPPRG